MDTVNYGALEEYLKLNAPTDGGFSLILLGAGRSGKSSFMVHLLGSVLLELYGKYIPLILTESPNSEPLQALDKNVFPICRTGYNNNLVKMMVAIGSTFKDKARPVILIDDCQTKHLRQRAVEDLVLLRRNEYVTTIIATHYINLITPAVRDTGNFIILLRVNSAAGEERVSKLFIEPLIAKRERKHARKFFNYVTTETRGVFLINGLLGKVYVVTSGQFYDFLKYFESWLSIKIGEE